MTRTGMRRWIWPTAGVVALVALSAAGTAYATRDRATPDRAACDVTNSPQGMWAIHASVPAGHAGETVSWTMAAGDVARWYVQVGDRRAVLMWVAVDGATASAADPVPVDANRPYEVTVSGTAAAGSTALSIAVNGGHAASGTVALGTGPVRACTV